MVGGACKYRRLGNYKIPKEYRIGFYFIRAKKLASNNVKRIDVILQAIDRLKENDKESNTI